MDSDSEFYGDEDTVSGLKARVDDFDVKSWWENHNSLTMLVRRDDPRNSAMSGRLHNPFEGRPGARELSETVDEFIARLPPGTTDWKPELDWIWIANPFIPGEKHEGLEAFREGGAERLRLLSEFIEMSEGSGKSPFVVKRQISKERDAAARDLQDLAVVCNVLGGKWMLFPEPTAVDEVWRRVARATANNDLGTAAKVDTRISSEKERLICVYTKDFRDKDDIARVLHRLRQLELVRQGGKQIYYKSNAWTELGIYGANKWNIKASAFSSNDIFAYIKDNFSRR